MLFNKFCRCLVTAELKYAFFCMLLFLSFNVRSQEMTGLELLNKAIRHHDPNRAWESFKGNLVVVMKTPDDKERVSDITIDLRQEYFKLTSTKDGVALNQLLDKDTCTLALNGSSEFSEEEAKTHRLSCERTKMMKDYYTYLYGLPMKLKDAGTRIAPVTERKTFKGKEYLVLKASYDEAVGKDTWYFYFDPETYAMEVYQFYHDESKNDGEYILLSGIEEVGTIKMPKTRAWYYNKDDKYLGTDLLRSGKMLD